MLFSESGNLEEPEAATWRIFFIFLFFTSEFLGRGSVFVLRF